MKKAVAGFVICCVIATFADNPHVTRLVELLDVAISAPADGDTLTFDAASGKWVNKPATPVPDGPRIVARANLTGGRGNNIANEFFVIPASGLYRATICAQITSGTPPSNTFVFFVDETGVNTNLIDWQTSVSPFCRQTRAQYITGGADISIFNADPVTFDAQLILEKL